MRHGDPLNEQLQTALNSRVVIEQANANLAERLGMGMGQTARPGYAPGWSCPARAALLSGASPVV
jgi:hypothetical protein